jgi:hypothetical protein
LICPKKYSIESLSATAGGQNGNTISAIQPARAESPNVWEKQKKKNWYIYSAIQVLPSGKPVQRCALDPKHTSAGSGEWASTSSVQGLLASVLHSLPELTYPLFNLIGSKTRLKITEFATKVRRKIT